MESEFSVYVTWPKSEKSNSIAVLPLPLFTMHLTQRSSSRPADPPPHPRLRRGSAPAPSHQKSDASMLENVYPKEFDWDAYYSLPKYAKNRDSLCFWGCLKSLGIAPML